MQKLRYQARRTASRHPKMLSASEVSGLLLLKQQVEQDLVPLVNEDTAISTLQPHKRRLALLLPGHNEELILGVTIASAVAAGQKIEDIYMVDDDSSDNTRDEALKFLPASNVLTVPRSGKAQAVMQAITHFKIVDNYTWVHVADADSVFGPNYFRHFRRKLDASKYVVAVGFVQSLRGNWISNYRALSYSYGQHVLRRLQSKLNMITVFPGPTTCFRTDIIEHLSFGTDSFTEDFDLTLQVHRKRLGKIVYIPEAVNFTQDPQNLGDFMKQTARWYRGFFQGVKKHKIGRHAQSIDLAIGYQLLEALAYFVQMGIVVPYLIYRTGNWLILPLMLSLDFIVMGIIALVSAAASKRLTILAALPTFYILRNIELAIYLKAFFEIVVFKKFRTQETSTWDTEGRRYALDSSALQDTASDG